MNSSVHSWQSSSDNRSCCSSKNSKSDSAGFYDDEASLERGDSSVGQYDEDERSPFDSFASIFLDIPFPAFLHICSFLTEDDYLTLLGVSRFFHRAITQADSAVWKALCFDKWKNRQGCHHFILFYQQFQKECEKHELQITALTQRQLLEEMQTNTSVVDDSPTDEVESSECHQDDLHFPPYQESTPSAVDTEGNTLPTTNVVQTSPRFSEAAEAAPTSASPSTSLCSFPSFLALRSGMHQKGHKVDIQRVNHSDSLASPPSAPFHSVFGKLSSEITAPQGSCFANSMKSSTNWSSCCSRGTSYHDSSPWQSTSEKSPSAVKVACKTCNTSSTRMNMENEIDAEKKKSSFPPSYLDSESHRKKSRKHVYQHRGLRRTRRYKKNHHPQHCKHRHRAKSHHKKRKNCHASSHQKSNPKMSRSARRRLRHQRSKQKALLLQQQPLEPTATLNAIHSTTPSIPLNKVDPCPLFCQKCFRGCTKPSVGVVNVSESAIGRKGYSSERSPIRTYWWDLSHEKRALLLSQQQRRQEMRGRTDKESSDKYSTLNDEESAPKMLDVLAVERDIAKPSSFSHGPSTALEESDDPTLPSRMSEGVSTKMSSNIIRRRRWSFHMDEANLKTKGLFVEDEKESSLRVHFSPTVVLTENSRDEERSESFRKTGIYQNSAHPALHSTSSSREHDIHNSGGQDFFLRLDFKNGSNFFPIRQNSFAAKMCRNFSALEESLLKIRASCTSRSTMVCRSTAPAVCDISPQKPSTLSSVKEETPRHVTSSVGSPSLSISVSPIASAASPLQPHPLSRSTHESTENSTFSLSPHLDALHASSPSLPLHESRTNCISVSALSQAEGLTSTRGDCDVAMSASACSSPTQKTNFPPLAHSSNSPAVATAVVASASTVYASPVVPTSTASSTVKEEDKHETLPFLILDGNQKGDSKENDEGDAIEYEPMSWKFAYYMSRRESRRKTITLDELVKGLWLACFRSTGRCHPVRFLESHQMEIFPPLPEVEEETGYSDLTQRDALVMDRRAEEGERLVSPIDGASIPTCARPHPSNSKEEVPYGSIVPIAIERFHVMQSGGALTLVPLNSNGMKSLTVQHRSSLAIYASNELNGNSSRSHNLLCKTPVPSSGVETSDPLAKFIAEPNYSVARLRQAAENLVLGKYRTVHSSLSRVEDLKFKPLLSGEEHLTSDEKAASSFQETTNFHSAIRFLFGWETSKRSFPTASRWIPPNISAEDENAVNDDWGWTISNDALKIFSVEISHPLYIERLKRACQQKCYLS